MHQGLDAQAASLTENNTALLQLIAQLEQLGAGNAAFAAGAAAPAAVPGALRGSAAAPDPGTAAHASAQAERSGACRQMQRGHQEMLYRRSWVSTAGPALHMPHTCNVAPWHNICSTGNSVGRPVRTCSSALACSAAHRRTQAGCWEHACRRRQGVRGCCVGRPWQTSGGIPAGCRECKQAPESVMCSALLDLSAWGSSTRCQRLLLHLGCSSVRAIRLCRRGGWPLQDT